MSALFLVIAPVLSASAASEPRVVAPSVVSTEKVEYGAVVDPADGALFFVRQDENWGEKGCGRIMRSAADGASWSEPEVFLGGESCYGDPFISPDGARFYFTSNKHEEATRADDDIWMMTRENGRFGKPTRRADLSSPGEEYSPVETDSGAMYFASTRAGGLGQGDIWVAREGAEPVNIGAPVNSATGEWNVFVAADETYLIVEASGRPDGRSPSGDLYLSRRDSAGWAAPAPLASLNTEGSDLMPRASPDGSTLYYTSTSVRGGKNADIYATALGPLLSLTANRLLAVVSRSAHELVLVDEESMTVSARLPAGRGAHEVALSMDRLQAFTPAYGIYPAPHDDPIAPSALRFVEGESGPLRKIALTTTGNSEDFAICNRSHGVAVTPDGNVWATCEEEATVLELDPATGAVKERWRTEAGSHQLAATPGNRFVVASNVDAGSISIIDRDAARVTHVATGAGAEGLAIAPDGQSVWVGNTQANTISVVPLPGAAPAHAFPSGGRFPAKLAFSSDGREVWVINTFSRAIAIFDSTSRALIDTLEFDSPPLGVAFAPEGDRVYLTFPRLNEVRAFDWRSREAVGAVTGIMEADGMAFVRQTRGE